MIASRLRIAYCTQDKSSKDTHAETKPPSQPNTVLLYQSDYDLILPFSRENNKVSVNPQMITTYRLQEYWCGVVHGLLAVPARKTNSAKFENMQVQ